MTSRSIVAIVVAASWSILVPHVARAQDESQRFRTGQIKVGDRILANVIPNGPTDSCTVTGIQDTGGWKPGFDGSFLLKCDHNGWYSVPATGDHAHLAGPATMAVTTATATTAPRVSPQPGNAFGTRNPRACDRVGSTPSRAQAAQLVACSREGQSRQNWEALVDDVAVSTITSSQYDPHTQTGFTNMDTSVAPLAIRGSLVAWDCTPADGPAMMAKYSNAGANCNRQVEKNATGYCYRMRTGAWSCSMNDLNIAQADKQYRLPPPR